MKIGDIAIIPLTLAITQALKNIFGIDGKTNQIVALCVAFVLAFMSFANQQALVPPEIMTWVEVVVMALVGGLSAIGTFDYVRDEVAQRKC